MPLPRTISRRSQVSTALLLAWLTESAPLQCIKLGAYDFALKPIEKDAFEQPIRPALEQRSLKAQISRLKQRLIQRRLEHPEAFSRVATNNQTMLALFSYVEAIAPSPEPVLITGSGTIR